jgi:peptide/nickel transport system substrate-binding protein
VALAIYDPLMDRGEDGEMHPYLAESLTPNEDLTEYTLKLARASRSTTARRSPPT